MGSAQVVGDGYLAGDQNFVGFVNTNLYGVELALNSRISKMGASEKLRIISDAWLPTPTDCGLATANSSSLAMEDMYGLFILLAVTIGGLGLYHVCQHETIFEDLYEARDAYYNTRAWKAERGKGSCLGAGDHNIRSVRGALRKYLFENDLDRNHNGKFEPSEVRIHN